MLKALALFFSAIILLIQPAAFAAAAESKPAVSDLLYERAFVQGPFGQVHVLTVQPRAGMILKTPLVLFHPTPYSSDYFKRFIPYMASDRMVIAMDTPGYGDSAKPMELQSIAGYAASAVAALQALSYGHRRPVDVLGYHTGALIAAELAAQRPDLVRRLVLPGIPFYTDEKAQREAYEKYVKAPTIAEDGSHLSAPWAFSSFTMEFGVELERAQAHFKDYMQCYPDCWHAYHSVFSYNGMERLPEAAQPALLISFTGSLDEETRSAGDYLPNATHIRFDDIAVAGFDLEPERIADAVRDFLDQ